MSSSPFALLNRTDGESGRISSAAVQDPDRFQAGTFICKTDDPSLDSLRYLAGTVTQPVLQI